MAKQKPTIPAGTRDFGPAEVAKRNYITGIIRKVYEAYGYMPLETPVMENLSTLLGKYGEEGDKLVFRILNSGDFLKDADDTLLHSKNSQKLAGIISEKGLRYDLTVPFARYVVMHQNEISFPFKRYQIQPVWRADRPQKGRYREFYQCDADVIGSKSMLLDAELVLIIKDVFSKLGISVTVRLNNRKILDGLAAYIGETEKKDKLITTIDKLDKIGMDKVLAELSSAGFSETQCGKIRDMLNLQGTAMEQLQKLETAFADERGKKGVEEMREVFTKLEGVVQEKVNITFDMKLARGLSYYTGTIYEVTANDVQIGSILGGGRYDDLTGIFGLSDMSGVGISFGLERIYDVLTELNGFPASATTGTQVLYIPFDADAEKGALIYAAQMRDAGIRCEVYPDLNAKTAKKFKYADDKQIPWCAVIGGDEVAQQKLSLKNMQSGDQQMITISEAITAIAGIPNMGFIDLSE
ncbi:MAG: histidine--tRNA ligase [Bacteroidia bacterium]